MNTDPRPSSHSPGDGQPPTPDLSGKLGIVRALHTEEDLRAITAGWFREVSWLRGTFVHRPSGVPGVRCVTLVCEAVVRTPDIAVPAAEVVGGPSQ